MINYGTALYAPMYATFGVAATLVIGATPYAVTAIDRTRGVDVGDDPEVKTVRPVATVRMSELVGVDLPSLDGATLTLNGQDWRVRAHRPKPSPAGELAGEIELILLDEGGT